VLAHAFVAELAARDDAATLFAHAGPGFGDFTRIAASSPEMWRDIALGNRDALLAELDRLRSALGAVRALVATGDGAALEALFNRARDARLGWQATRGGERGAAAEGV
jgi:prephenate dehydrogenase